MSSSNTLLIANNSILSNHLHHHNHHHHRHSTMESTNDPSNAYHTFLTSQLAAELANNKSTPSDDLVNITTSRICKSQYNLNINFTNMPTRIPIKKALSKPISNTTTTCTNEKDTNTNTININLTKTNQRLTKSKSLFLRDLTTNTNTNISDKQHHSNHKYLFNKIANNNVTTSTSLNKNNAIDKVTTLLTSVSAQLEKDQLLLLTPNKNSSSPETNLTANATDGKTLIIIKKIINSSVPIY